MKQEIIDWFHHLNDGSLFAIKALITLIVVLVINITIKLVLQVSIKKASRTHIPWDEMVLRALSLPLRVYIWILGILYLINALSEWLEAKGAIIVIGRVFQLATVILCVWFLFRFLNRCEKYFTKRFKRKDGGKVDGTSVRAAVRFCQIIILAMMALMVLGIFKIPLTGLLTFGGVGAAAIAFGSKDLLANFAGGIMVYFNRHFAVGDWIYSPDRQIEGTVEEIGWRLTLIRSFDKRPIYVPNAVFNSIIVINASRMTNRRIKQTFGVRYDDATKIREIVEKVQAMLKSHPDIDQDGFTMTCLTEFAHSSINFMIYTFTKTTVWADYQAIQDDVMLQVERIIHECGAECAFPTTTLHVPEKVLVDMQSS